MNTITIPVTALILLVWVTSTLTSSVNSDVNPNGQSPTLASEVNFTIRSETNSQSTPSPTQLSQKLASDKITTKHNTTEQLIMGEGGPIEPTNLKDDDVLPKDEGNDHSIEKSSMTSKIVPRKGADLDNTDIHLKMSTMKSATPILNTTAKVQDTNATILNNTSCLNGTINESLCANTTSSSYQENSTSVIQKAHSVTTTHKPKPTATIGSSDMDGPMPAFSSKTSPFGMPRKIDYVIPIAITVIALPILGAATYIVYKRGRDCWDKRHYRRMDFLIDGMYND